MGTRRMTRSMVKEEFFFQEKDKAFRTYKRKSRNFHIEKEVDPAQQKDYAQIKFLEAQEKEKEDVQAFENENIEGQDASTYSTYNKIKKGMRIIVEEMGNEDQIEE